MPTTSTGAPAPFIQFATTSLPAVAFDGGTRLGVSPGESCCASGNFNSAL
jgi:hypothetical protein